jgi:hypothetical protein
MTIPSHSKAQVLVAVYPNGLLLTINGESYFKHMNVEQKLNMAQELIHRSVHEIRHGKEEG